VHSESGWQRRPRTRRQLGTKDDDRAGGQLDWGPAPDREEEMDLLTAAAVVGVWIALQWWVLPRLGVPT
jgi:hypothetical protein